MLVVVVWDLPDKYPLMSLSSVLNCWRYLSLEACGMDQSFVPIFGELLVNDVVEEEFELRKERCWAETWLK